MKSPESLPQKKPEKKESFLSRQKKKILIYFLLGSGAAAIGSNPRISESLALAVPGIHESYEHVFLNKEEQALSEEIKKELGEVMGNFALSMIETGESISNPEEREEILEKETGPTPSVNGFEKIGISNEYVSDLITKTLPKGSQLQIAGVTYGLSSLEREEKDLYQRFIAGRNNIVAVTNPVSQKITFLRKPTDAGVTTANLIAGYLLHEQTHAGDWSSNKLLTRKEKMQLLLAILKRLKAPDRFLSGQVDSVKGESKFATYTKAHEYFAEINKVYLTTFEEHRLSNADIAIASTFNRTMEPGFDQNEAIATRYELIGHIDNNQEFLDRAKEIREILHPKIK